MLLVGLGVMLFAVGVPLLLGRWKPKGKPRVVGAMLVLVGATMAVLCGTSLPYERLTITRNEVRYATGLFGERQKRVNLANVEKIVLYKGRRPRNSPRHSRGPITYVEFVSTDGPSIHIKMREFNRGPAIEYLLELAPQLGIELDDQRGEYERYRLHNPLAPRDK